MTIANVALTDTFDLWRTRFNQSVTYLNTFDANNITFTSNSATLTISGTGRLGSTLYFDIGTISTSVSDQSTSNIASANSVYKAYNQANAAYNQANTGATYAYVNTATQAANTYADTIGAASNGWANTVGAGANTWANTKLSNTSGTTFAGSFYIPSGSNLGVGTASPAANLDVIGLTSDAKANVLSQTLTDAATIAWDASLGRVATVTLGASRTFGAPSNLRVGTYILHVIQGGTGSYTITWNGVFKWPAGVAPTLTTTVGARDVMSFISDGTNLYGTYINDVK